MAASHNALEGRTPLSARLAITISPQRFIKTAARSAGRTGSSAPTGRCAWSPKMRAILRLRPVGSMGASTPTQNNTSSLFTITSYLFGPAPTLRRNVAAQKHQSSTPHLGRGRRCIAPKMRCRSPLFSRSRLRSSCFISSRCVCISAGQQLLCTGRSFLRAK